MRYDTQSSASGMTETKKIIAWSDEAVAFFNVKLCVYHPGVFIRLNKTVFISQTHLLLLYLMYYSGKSRNMLPE